MQPRRDAVSQRPAALKGVCSQESSRYRIPPNLLMALTMIIPVGRDHNFVR